MSKKKSSMMKVDEDEENQSIGRKSHRSYDSYHREDSRESEREDTRSKERSSIFVKPS